jgi:hypothetical protein
VKGRINFQTENKNLQNVKTKCSTKPLKTINYLLITKIKERITKISSLTLRIYYQTELIRPKVEKIY